jgi:hypothetical protein
MSHSQSRWQSMTCRFRLVQWISERDQEVFWTAAGHTYVRRLLVVASQFSVCMNVNSSIYTRAFQPPHHRSTSSQTAPQNTCSGSWLSPCACGLIAGRPMGAVFKHLIL